MYVKKKGKTFTSVFNVTHTFIREEEDDGTGTR